jgi:hypothetical protein
VAQVSLLRPGFLLGNRSYRNTHSKSGTTAVFAPEVAFLKTNFILLCTVLWLPSTVQAQTTAQASLSAALDDQIGDDDQIGETRSVTRPDR